MPLYAYACPSCTREFELLRPMSQAAQEATCPTCQGRGRRVLSVFAAFASGPTGESAPLAGAGGCACGAGGSCACARG